MNDNKIINCLKCYRVHHCGDDVYFCPFFGINPCIRGEHAVIIKKSVKVKPIKQEIKIPDFVPFLRNTPIKSALIGKHIIKNCLPGCIAAKMWKVLLKALEYLKERLNIILKDIGRMNYENFIILGILAGLLIIGPKILRESEYFQLKLH